MSLKPNQNKLFELRSRSKKSKGPKRLIRNELRDHESTKKNHGSNGAYSPYKPKRRVCYTHWDQSRREEKGKQVKGGEEACGRPRWMEVDLKSKTPGRKQ
jgi:hypothetical protein